MHSSPLSERDRRALDALDSGAEPTQEPRSTDALAPHQTLARAILFDAFLHRVACTRKGRVERCKQCERDMRWLSSDSEKYLFSFVNICTMLKRRVGQTRRRFLSQVAAYAGQEQGGVMQRRARRAPLAA